MPKSSAKRRRFVNLLRLFRQMSDASGRAPTVLLAKSVLEFLMARVLIGTSGWGYGSWRGPFFPMEVPGQTSPRILCEPVRHGGAERRILSHANARVGPALA